MVVKKVVRKTVVKKRSFSAGGHGREQSPLRPRHVERKPPCTDRCPSGNRIREFLTTISQAELLGKTTAQAFTEAWEVLTDTNPFPSVCGRVCPALCEEECNRRELEGAVGINKVERAVGDFGREGGLKLRRLSDERKPQRVAVVGAGPGGLSCAYQLARRGYGVKVFEAQVKPGGMLRYGIPGYRLPEGVLDEEIGRILDLGVELECGVKVGEDVTLDELKGSFAAVFLALGAQQGVSLGVDGEDAPNVFSGVDFLNRFHHGEQLGLGKDVVVIVVGGGDTAIDAARISKRLGANVTVLYRRTLAEMPAIHEEVQQAINEGVEVEFLAAPVGFKKGDDGRVTALEAIRMELGEPDASGRRSPVPIPGSEFEIPATAVISAVSQKPDFRGLEAVVGDGGWVAADDDGRTGVDGVWAGGDVTQLALVTDAIGQGRRAAEAIDRELQGTTAVPDGREVIRAEKLRLGYYPRKERLEPPLEDIERRLAEPESEVNLGFTLEQAQTEAARCMSCGQCFYCEECWLFCQDQAIEKPAAAGELYPFKLVNCTGCDKCADICPCGFIEMA